MSNPSKLLVAQGGGPTAVINQSLAGVVLEARKFSRVEKIYGAFHGVRGIVNEDFVDLAHETTANLELVAATPSAPTIPPGSPVTSAFSRISSSPKNSLLR